jgi:diguanylate cyclase (GGDEF)-like protein
MAESAAKRRLVIDLLVILAGILLAAYALQVWFNYRYLTSRIAERAEGALDQHIGAIWRFHDSQFTHSQAVAKLIAAQYRQSWLDTSAERASHRFHELYETRANGETLLRPQFHDFKKHPSAGAPKGSKIDAENQKKLATGYDLIDQFGASLFGSENGGFSQLFSAFIWYPDSGITVFSPNGEWAIVDATWDAISEYPSVKGAMPANNPTRDAFWSPVYFDKDVKTWMTTYSVPIDINGNWIATAGVDVSLEQLLSLTHNPVLPGSYNVILRNDGEIVAHPELKGFLVDGTIPLLKDPALAVLRKTLGSLKGPVVVDDPNLNYLYGMAPLPGPGLAIAIVLPREVISNEAFGFGKMSLISGLLAMLAALAGIYFALSKRVLQPLKILHNATRKLMHGEAVATLTPHAQDELGEVTHAFGEMAERLADRQRALTQQATHDALTSLPNRSELFQRLSNRIGNNAQDRFAVMFIDLDRFKTINDSLGHHYGDLLLREVAARMQQVLPSDVDLGRFGGDEFLMIVNPISAAAWSAEAVAKALQEPFDLANRKILVTCSIGISQYPDHGADPTVLIQHADTAMYHAKALGRNRYAVYSGRLGEIAERNFLMESRFREAITNNSFRYAYQRVVTAGAHETFGAESLLRWFDDELGYVPPDQVVALAEELGFSADLAKITIENAFSFFQRHEHELPANFKLAINLSAEQFSSSSVIDHIIARFSRSTTNMQRIEVEITESTLLIDSRIAQEHIERLANAGVAVGIDDFGTGYASLSYLQRYAIKFMKIDRSFTQMIESSDDHLPIIEVMIDLAHKLGLRITVEGIETKAQVEYFQRRGDMLLQGYYFGMPDTDSTLLTKPQRSNDDELLIKH